MLAGRMLWHCVLWEIGMEAEAWTNSYKYRVADYGAAVSLPLKWGVYPCREC